MPDVDEAPPRAEQALRLREVQARVAGVSKATIYNWIAQGKFPAPVKIGPSGGVACWRGSEVDAWLAAELAK